MACGPLHPAVTASAAMVRIVAIYNAAPGFARIGHGAMKMLPQRIQCSLERPGNGRQHYIRHGPKAFGRLPCPQPRQGHFIQRPHPEFSSGAWYPYRNPSTPARSPGSAPAAPNLLPDNKCPGPVRDRQSSRPPAPVRRSSFASPPGNRPQASFKTREARLGHRPISARTRKREFSSKPMPPLL